MIFFIVPLFQQTSTSGLESNEASSSIRVADSPAAGAVSSSPMPGVAAGAVAAAAPAILGTPPSAHPSNQAPAPVQQQQPTVQRDRHNAGDCSITF